MFGTNTPLSFYVKQCKDIYGISIQRTKREIRWANTEYGEYKLAKTGATRIIFPNGSVDPWHALSYLKSEGNIVAIYIKGKVKILSSSEIMLKSWSMKWLLWFIVG